MFTLARTFPFFTLAVKPKIPAPLIPVLESLAQAEKEAPMSKVILDFLSVHRKKKLSELSGDELRALRVRMESIVKALHAHSASVLNQCGVREESQLVGNKRTFYDAEMKKQALKLDHYP